MHFCVPVVVGDERQHRSGDAGGQELAAALVDLEALPAARRVELAPLRAVRPVLVAARLALTGLTVLGLLAAAGALLFGGFMLTGFTRRRHAGSDR